MSIYDDMEVVPRPASRPPERTLAETTFYTIRRLLAQYQRPAVLWSAGKDSMVLLHFVRAIDESVPVIFFREPFFPAKYQFANRIAREWNLTLYDWPPASVTAQHNDQRFELVNHHSIAPGRVISLPKNLYEASEPMFFGPEQNTLCGLKDLLERPRGMMNAPWDILFHGHKSSDTDPLLGQVPLTVDICVNPDGPAIAFPLRHWTDADIWSYSSGQGIPQQQTRYLHAEPAGYFENPDKTMNPDYWSVCTRCLDKRNPAVVHCPKLGLEIPNISDRIPTHEPLRPAYIGPAK